jgi:hypothetical protein
VRPVFLEIMDPSKRSRTSNTRFSGVYVDPDFIWISDEEYEPAVSLAKVKKRKITKKNKEEREQQSDKEEDSAIPTTPPLSLKKGVPHHHETLQQEYMRGLGVTIQDALQQNMKRSGNLQTCSIMLVPVGPKQWRNIVDSFSCFGKLIVTNKVVRGKQEREFEIKSEEHLISLEELMGKSWWKVEEVLATDGEEVVYVGTLSVSFFKRNKRAKRGASKFPIKFRFEEEKFRVRIGMSVYYETESGDITRGTKEDSYYPGLTFRKNTEQEQVEENEFLEGFE